MKKKTLGILTVLLLLILSACSSKEENNADADVEVYPLEVDLTVTEKVEVGDTVQMEAIVTYGDEKVADADEVVYEIWEEGKKDESYKIEATNEKDGSYTAETSFDHDGLFHVQVHVTAKQLHTMPVKEVTVGNGGHYENSGEEHDHGHAEGFSMHFNELDGVTTGEEIDLTTHIQMEEKPMENLNVRYEIWNDAEDNGKHEWADASESSAGEYKASYQFDQAGTYKVQIHVKDDEDLHEHETVTIEVTE